MFHSFVVGVIRGQAESLDRPVDGLGKVKITRRVVRLVELIGEN